MTYSDLVERKKNRLRPRMEGIDVSDLHPALYDFQKIIVQRALRLGSCALIEDCGMGKTIQALEWAKHVSNHTDKPVLIFTPLAVGAQMMQESEKIELSASLVRSGKEVKTPVAITNYEMMHHFNPADFGGVVLDESSILKNRFGTMRNRFIEFSHGIPFRLSATATPAPNDLMELLNQAAYLHVSTVNESLALWFVNDQQQTQSWRLKGHSVNDFWKWVGSWAIALDHPRRAGFQTDGYDLPEMTVKDRIIKTDRVEKNGLFHDAQGISDQRKNRRLTMDERVSELAELVNSDDDYWVVWCELNEESEKISKAIPDSVEIVGSESIEAKERKLIDFSEGRTRVLVTKPSIAGHGLNWQHCNQMAFAGIGFSYEMQYQAIRRCWRYGQKRPVTVHRIMTDADESIAENLKRKESVKMSIYDLIPWQLNLKNGKSGIDKSMPEYMEKNGDGWKLMLGDCVETIKRIDTDSVGLSIFSPPFPGMYVYTDSPNDMGNVQSIEEMIEQFSFLMTEDAMMRVLKPGRSVFIHITQGVAQLNRDGYIGLKDFRGSIISMMENQGWIYYGEVCIDKNPQAKAVRTKDSGLMFKSLANDASRMHPAMADFLLQFRKPGDNPEPIRAGQSETYGNMSGWVSPEDWILWARPVWYSADYQPVETNDQGINENDTLNFREARANDDERHICPLQIGVIERCIKVWSNPNDLVYSPFAGIGSEGYVALKYGRRFIGSELKREYFNTASSNLNAALQLNRQIELNL